MVRIFLFIIFLFSLTSSIALFFLFDSVVVKEDPIVEILSLAAAIVFLAIFVINLSLFKLESTSLPMSFLLMVALFHLGMLVPFSLGLTQISSLTALLDGLSHYDVTVFSKAVLCFFVFLFAFESGVVFCILKRDPIKKSSPYLHLLKINSHLKDKYLYRGGILLFILALLMVSTNFLISGASGFFSGQYSKEFLIKNDTRLLATGLYFLMPAALVIALCGTQSKGDVIIVVGLFIAISFLYLWLGDRGDLFFFACSFIFAWRRLNYKFSRMWLFFGCLIALLLTSFIGVFRQHDRSDIGAESIARAVSQVSMVSALVEMGGSVRTLAGTLALVPDKYAFRYGESYLSAAFRILPNLGMTRRSAEDRPIPEKMPPNHWITIRMNEYVFRAGGGYGFSAVAEPYLNFGIWGIAVYFSLLGYLLTVFDFKTLMRRDRYMSASCALVLMALLVTVRNDFENFLRPAVWGVSLVWMIRFGSSLLLSNKTPIPVAKRMVGANDRD